MGPTYGGRPPTDWRRLGKGKVKSGPWATGRNDQTFNTFSCCLSVSTFTFTEFRSWVSDRQIKQTSHSDYRLELGTYLLRCIVAFSKFLLRIFLRFRRFLIGLCSNVDSQCILSSSESFKRREEERCGFVFGPWLLGWQRRRSRHRRRSCGPSLQRSAARLHP